MQPLIITLIPLSDFSQKKIIIILENYQNTKNLSAKLCVSHQLL